jgi:hypothetical protein
VAVKIHIGEWNRTRCLRPELVVAMYEFVVYEPPLTREHYDPRYPLDSLDEVQSTTLREAWMAASPSETPPTVPPTCIIKSRRRSPCPCSSCPEPATRKPRQRG